MKKVLVTGSQGFLGSYICRDLLAKDYQVLGVDNYSKYGKIERSHDGHPNFKILEMDLDKPVPGDALDEWNAFEPDYIICAAAMIGGIGYFHKYAYDLLATNERILGTTFDKGISSKDTCKRIIVLSSSMAFENTKSFPTKEEEITKCPPPFSTYGFQKLACEYFAKGAWEQYGLPYTIIRPFNCVGVGEHFFGEESEKLNLGHVLPSLIYKILSNQNPVEILGDGNQVRCFTNGVDFARGVRMALESDKAFNEDFNLSISKPLSILELAKMIWEKLREGEDFNYKSTPAFAHDVQLRVADVTKAKEILGFTAEISIEESINEVIEHVRELYFKESLNG
tara:strand:+ start:1631 stop:2647 length:1017 start_codon:yes stop_codon:yes gene_type:complete